MSRTADRDELLPLCEESGLNPAAAAAILADTIAPAQPKPELRDRLTARIAAYEELKPLAELRTHEGAWSSAGAAPHSAQSAAFTCRRAASAASSLSSGIDRASSSRRICLTCSGVTVAPARSLSQSPSSLMS